MKTIIWGDTHQRHKLLKWHIENLKYDKFILLGDYFDSFDENEMDVIDTALLVKKYCRSKKFVFLMGNHDNYYRYQFNNRVKGGGYNFISELRINEILNQTDWNALKYCTEEQGWLITHAGVSNTFYEGLKDKYQFTIPKLKREITRNIKACQKGELHNLFGAGFARKGSFAHGGILWCDWNKEFRPIRGLKQIVGHTTVDAPECKDENNWNLDTDNKYYGVLENGKLKIEKI